MNAINNCAVNYDDECFGVLHRARTKQHLVVLEALYILFYKPTMSKQHPKHSLNLIGDNCCLTRGGFNYFFPPPWSSCIFIIFTPPPFNKLICLHCFKSLQIDSLEKYRIKGLLRFQYLFSIYYLLKSWRQHPTRHQLYGHLPPLTKTIPVRRTRHAEHCWGSRDKLISYVLLWIPTHGRAKAGRPARTYIQQQCEDTGCCPEDLPEAMNDREKWRDRVRDIRATSTTWW